MTLHRLTLCAALLLMMAASALTSYSQSNAPLPSDINADSRARLPYLQRKNLNEADQKIYDVLPGRRQDGSLGGPLAFSAYNPAVAKALYDLHNAAVAGTLTPRVRELAIMVACRETNYSLEWNGHEATAVKEGVDPKVIDVIRKNGALTGLDDKDATVIRLGRQLYTDKKVDSATFGKAVEYFGQRGVMDILAVMNTYAVSGFYAIAVDEHPPANRPALERTK
jgi:4-carboxymuconolactone decarboxylase